MAQNQAQPINQRSNGPGLVQGGNAQRDAQALGFLAPNQIRQIGKLPVVKGVGMQPCIGVVHCTIPCRYAAPIGLLHSSAPKKNMCRQTVIFSGQDNPACSHKTQPTREQGKCIAKHRIVTPRTNGSLPRAPRVRAVCDMHAELFSKVRLAQGHYFGSPDSKSLASRIVYFYV